MEGEDDPPVPVRPKPLFFGGATVEREDEPEESEAMRVAGRINEALRLKRAPRPPTLKVFETGWYEELGIDPSATQEQLRMRYLEHAAAVEERLAYLLEERGSSQALLEGGDETDEEAADEEQVGAEDEERGTVAALSEEDREDDDDPAGWTESVAEVDEDADEGEGDMERAMLLDIDQLRGVPAPTDDEVVVDEAEQVALEFLRVSNLYQILSVPQLRKIYDEGGVEALAVRVPKLHKGLLEPERVLRMARGLQERVTERPSLLLRKMPRQPGFAKYQAANSIKQVLRRLTDVFRVWCFKSGDSLKRREGTIYTELPEVAVVGRVGSGKSALIQHMLSAGRMRHKHLATSSQWPGKTQGVDVFCVNRRFTIADTPGYGKWSQHATAQRICEDWDNRHKPLMEEYLNTTSWLRAAVFVHDIAKDVTQEDRDMIQMLKRHGVPSLLVFTKDDKVDSDTHRVSRVKALRRALHWPPNWPHAHYTTRRGGYGQVFKNMLGTMLLGLIATETREDAWDVLKNELPEIFRDYRDKYVPRPKGPRGEKLPPPKKVRTYDQEDKVYTDADLEAEERTLERKEKKRVRAEQAAAGYKRTVRDDIEEQVGKVLTPKERRRRWQEMLENANTRR